MFLTTPVLICKIIFEQNWFEENNKYINVRERATWMLQLERREWKGSMLLKRGVYNIQYNKLFNTDCPVSKWPNLKKLLAYNNANRNKSWYKGISWNT